MWATLNCSKAILPKKKPVPQKQPAKAHAKYPPVRWSGWTCGCSAEEGIYLVLATRWYWLRGAMDDFGELGIGEGHGIGFHAACLGSLGYELGNLGGFETKGIQGRNFEIVAE